jgi:hypothetical protein
LRVLTFNSHQPYLHLMAASLPWTLGVVIPRLPSGSTRDWDPGIRPVLPNIRLYRSAREALRDCSWDWFLAHNVHDLLDAREISLPKAFLVHGTLSGRILQDRSSIDRSRYIENLRTLLAANNAGVVYVSDLKRRDWGMPGTVIRSAVDTGEYEGYSGEIRGVLQVCNHLKERGAMLGWNAYQAVCRDLPYLVLGENGSLPSSRIARDWEDLKKQLRSYRIYLFTAVFPYEDGYNLALLEAMATGMPVATMRHSTSPVRDGMEGVVADSPEELREKVVWLLDRPDEAAKMGKNARERAEAEFPLSAFQSAWESYAAEMSRI